MVIPPADIGDIPDFPDQPGQRPTPGAPSGVVPVQVILINAPLDREYRNIAVKRAAVDTYLDAEVAANRFFDAEIERWDIGAPIQVALAFVDGAGFNYARFIVGTGDSATHYYAFIDATYANLTMTAYAVTIDEWTTYQPTLGYSMVERGHVAVAASENDTYGAQYLTAPEPIDAPPVQGVLDAALLGSQPGAWTVLVVSANNLAGGAGFPYWDHHVQADNIANAGNMATAATVSIATDTDPAAPQITVPDAEYPWAVTTGAVTPGTGTPINGYVPESVTGVPFLVDLVSGPASLPPSPTGPIQAEAHTAEAWASLKADHPEAVLGGPAAGYWTRALDKAIHADPEHYGVVDTGLSPIGQSPHGLGVRLNFTGVSEAVANTYGFLRYNDYTWTYEGPYIWAGMAPGHPSVFVPKVEASPLSTIDGVSAGGGVYLFTLEGFAEYMTIMQGAPWVTGGIIDVRLVPSWAVAGGGDATFTPTVPSLDPSDGMWDTASAIPVYAPAVISQTATPAVLAGWRASALAAVGGGSWRKLLTSPFTDLLVGNGDTMTSFKPDQWQTDAVGFQAVTGAAHGDPAIRIIPTGYNDLGSQMGVETPVGGQAGLMNAGFASAASNTGSPVITPYMAAFSSLLNHDISLKNNGLAKEIGLTEVALNAGVQAITGGLSGATGAIGGALGAKSGEGYAGAIGGLANSALKSVAGMITSQVAVSNTVTMLDISNDDSFDIAAYQLGVSGIGGLAAFSTWLQSLSSVSGSGSPGSLASSWRAILGQAFHVIIAMPSAERIKKLTSEWDRYGYMIGQAFVPGRLDPMTKRSYWKTSETTILGNMPQSSRQVMAAVFEQGTTVWTAVADIGTHPANTPRDGISY